MLRFLRLIALVLSIPLALFLSGNPSALARTRLPEAKPLASASTATAARPALWKVSDADTTVWLFGTIHVLPPELHWLDGPVARALRQSSLLVTELPETSPADMQAAVVAHALLPQGQTLRALLTEADRIKFDAATAQLGFGPAAFDNAQPWLAAMSLALVPVRNAGYDPAKGADEAIAAEAKAMGLPREGLESADSQMALFAGLPREVQLKYLREVIDGIPTIKTELADMVRAWSTGQADKVAELDNDKQDDPRMVAALITDRNRAWADWIAKRLNQPGTVFMAVGAGHLAGKDSVQAMLTQRGLTVTRVQ